MALNKSELAAKVAEKADLSKADAQRAIDASLEVITDGVKSGDGVSLVGFGTFELTTRAARQGRNPQTGEAIEQMGAAFSESILRMIRGSRRP